MKIKTYFLLTKPGIIIGNGITAAAGFALASKESFDFLLFLAALAGISLIIASACVLNNYIDRDSDRKMARTKNRALAKKTIPAASALFFAVCLGLTGLLILGFYTNLLTLLITLAGFCIYVLWYSLWKYRTMHATLIGSLAGAAPAASGYSAAAGSFDVGALLLFSIMVLWQMPHFFAIAIYRIDDYASAGVPVLPLKRGMFITKVQMLLYIIAFTGAAAALTFFGYAGYAYASLAALLGLVWLSMGIQGFTCKSDKRWAYKMFRFSLLTVTALCLSIFLRLFQY